MLWTTTVTGATEEEEEEEEEEEGEEGMEDHLSPPPGASGFVSPPAYAPTPLPPFFPHTIISSTAACPAEHVLLLLQALLLLLLPLPLHLLLGRQLSLLPFLLPLMVAALTSTAAATV